jgi:hypothetical protein
MGDNDFTNSRAQQSLENESHKFFKVKVSDYGA